MTDRHEAIYKEDANFYRYQDRLMWSRFQVAATIEGGLLYVVYGRGVTIPTETEKAIFIAVLSLIVLIICRIAWRDGALGTAHLKRIKKFEKDQIEFEPPSWKGPTGLRLMLLIMWLLNLGNAAIVIKTIWRVLPHSN